MTVTLKVRTIVSIVTALVVGVVATLLVIRAWEVDAAPGDLDATFVPTAGCRLVDTRPAPDNVGPRTTPLGADDVFEVLVRGANGECTGPLAIPADAVGVALNATAVNATTSSNLRLYPANLTDVPLLSNLNVTAGAPPTPNKVDVQLSPDGRIRVYNFRGSVDVVLDVVGYYTRASLQELAARVNELEAARSFAVSAHRDDFADLTTVPGEIVSVAVTAPVDGHVTVNYSAWIGDDFVRYHTCAPYRSTEVPATQISFDAEGVSTWADNGDGSVSGTRLFPISAGETVTYVVACEQSAGSSGFFRGRTITAIFTPAVAGSG